MTSMKPSTQGTLGSGTVEGREACDKAFALAFDKEYLAHKAITDMMPHLNRIFEELGIHHEEHDVPAKVHKSLEDKARKATAKNAIAVAEAKKRKRGLARPRLSTRSRRP